MTRLLRHITLWLAKRYLRDELGLYAHIITQPWYPVVKMQVKRAEATKSAGMHKRVFAENAVKAVLHAKGYPVKEQDLHLAIELAVREVC